MTPSVQRRRWLGATPLDYIPGPTGFWFRDLGGLCQEFLRLGLESKFIVYGRPDQMEPEKPLILCTREEMASADWWRSQRPDVVVMNSWGRPTLTPVVRAIKGSGARLIIRLDTDGNKSPRTGFWRFLSTCYYDSVEQPGRIALPYALAKTMAFRLFPQAHDAKFAEHLGLADVVTVESNLAKIYVERLLRAVGRGEVAAKLRVIPHFAMVDRGFDGAAGKKKRQILAVGRWESVQKDGPKLIRVLGKVLADRTDYSAVVVGGGIEAIEPLRQRLPAEVGRRIELAGFLPHDQVQQHCRESQIMLFTSRYEGFPFAASEALCCGCAVVGPVTLPAIVHIATCGGGTPARTRSDQDLADAVAAEMIAWDAGWRDPEALSRWWMNQVSLKSVARQLLNFEAEWPN